MEKVGRNDLCPCGSGKKYKKCCLGKDENKLVISDPFEELDVDKMLSDYAEMEIPHGMEQAYAQARFIPSPYALSNKQPCDDFDGLTPVQMLKLINVPFESPEIVEFPEVMTGWPETPVMRLLVTLLQEIGLTGMKLKKDGSLPTKAARELVKAYFQEEAVLEFMKDGTIDDDLMFDGLSQILELAATVGIIDCMKGSLSLSAECRRLLGGAGVQALYPMILRAAAEDVPWGRGDDFPEMFEFQDTFAFSLYMLHKYGDEFRTNTFYEDAILRAFPTLLQDEDGNPMIEGYESGVRFCYTSRALVDYAGFLGLIEIAECPDDDDPMKIMVKKTPLLDDAVRFKI